MRQFLAPASLHQLQMEGFSKGETEASIPGDGGRHLVTVGTDVRELDSLSIALLDPGAFPNSLIPTLHPPMQVVTANICGQLHDTRIFNRGARGRKRRRRVGARQGGGLW
jgi:hypothetical protein